MSTMAQDEITEINEAVGQRWRSIDPLLPEPTTLPEGCGAPLTATAHDGNPAGLAVCRHQLVPAGSLSQTWDAATKFTLTMRLREADTRAAADDLLTQWRDHLADLPEEAREDDTSAVVTWPSRDVTGIRALIKHALQPITVIAVRRAGLPAPKHGETHDLVIRHAEPAHQGAVTELELGVIHYDAHFGAAFPRPATPQLVREATRKNLEQRPDWTWLAERRGQAGRPGRGRATRRSGMDRGPDPARPDGLPVVHVHEPRGKGHRDRRKAHNPRARRA